MLLFHSFKGTISISLTNCFIQLKPEVDDERKWIIKIQGAALLSSPENYKSPVVSPIQLSASVSDGGEQ